MVKLFLAEDEIAMREGIRRHIQWAEEGIEFCGEAGDGELAWPMIREQKPDILITDIKMPFMDGLQLTGLVRKELPDTKIIILSGYSEFRYAQEALRLGVTEYLLKPVTPKQLREVVHRIAVSIEEEKKNREERNDWLLEEAREKEEQDRRKLFHALISGEFGSRQILELAQETDIALGAPFYRLLLVFIFSESEFSSQEEAAEKVKSSAEEISGCLLFEHSLDSMAVLLSGDSDAEIEERTRQFQEMIISVIRSWEKMHYFVSAGRTVTHLSEIHTVYREVYNAAAHRFFLVPDQTITSDTPVREMVTQNNPNPINTESALQNGNLRNIWDNFMRTGTLHEADNFVEDVFSSIGEDNVHSILFLNYLTMDCYFIMARFLKEMGKNPHEIEQKIGNINAAVGKLQSAEDARSYLTIYLKEVIRIRENNASSKNSQLLKNALAYIDSHYTQSSLSLQDTAEAAGLSPNRFSTLFSHEMGMTFIDYLTRRRIEHACRLLMTTDLRSSEIAYQSGYNDPHYFSAAFKKVQGMSPKEYRRR